MSETHSAFSSGWAVDTAAPLDPSNPVCDKNNDSDVSMDMDPCEVVCMLITRPLS